MSELEDFMYKHTNYDPDAMPEDIVPLDFHRFLPQIYLNKLSCWYIRAIKSYPSDLWLKEEEKIILYEERIMHPIIAIQEAIMVFTEVSDDLRKLSHGFLRNLNKTKKVIK